MSLRIVSALSCCLLCTLPSHLLNAQDRTKMQESQHGLKSAYLSPLYPSSHAANLLNLANGDTLCFWFSGSWEGESGVGIVMARLPHGSNQWGQTTLIDRQDGKSFQNPIAFQDPKGKLWLFHTSQTAGKGQADAQVFVLNSTDNGKTWTAPRLLFSKAGSFTRQPVVVRKDGAWLLPLFFTPTAGITKGAESNYSVVELSKDDGKTWKECSIPSTSGLVHPDVLPLKDGTYLMLLRSRYADWIYRATSKDGCNWTAPVPTVLPNNNASIQARVLKDGHIVLAFNNVNAPKPGHKPGTGPRVPLSVALSTDNGQTWGWVRDIETLDKGSSGAEHFPKREGRDEFSYPSILQRPDGSIMVAYTHRRTGIKVVEFAESWIKAGKTEGMYKPPMK